MGKRIATIEVRDFSRILVTGGAGFIGSHLVDRLMEMGCNVRVVDNLSRGNLKNIEAWIEKPGFDFVRGDLKRLVVAERVTKDIELVFHLAANPEVRAGEVDPIVHFQENLQATFNILEAMRHSRGVRAIVFFSSSTVYGEPSQLPTPEDYGPLSPISVYGASKLGCESLVSSFCHTFDMRGVILRLANVVGKRSNHGVIFDFVNKLRKDSEKLEILGDGKQTKSYLHISDFLDAVFFILHNFFQGSKCVDVFNVGSLDQVSVKRIAEIVCREMSLKNVELRPTGGIDGGRGWKGDVKNMLLSIEKLSLLGWQPRLDSEDSVVRTCEELLKGRDG